MKTNMLIFFGMLGFMIIYPTTFFVLLNGADLLPRMLKQMYPFFNFI
jgi:hypothetical protein